MVWFVMFPWLFLELWLIKYVKNCWFSKKCQFLIVYKSRSTHRKVDKPYHFLDQIFILFPTKIISEIFDELENHLFFHHKVLTKWESKMHIKKLPKRWGFRHVKFGFSMQFWWKISFFQPCCIFVRVITWFARTKRGLSVFIELWFLPFQKVLSKSLERLLKSHTLTHWNDY